MNEDLKRRIVRAKELLNTARHVAMATVNKDGSPHNTPIRFLYDPKLEYIYWGSHPDSVHSINIKRAGKIFLVLYDAIQRGGLYMKCENAKVVDGDDLKKALEVHNSFRVKEGSEPLTIEYYTSDSPQRMWRALITNFWVNTSEKGKNNHLIKDGREEVTAKDLLS